MNFIDRAVAFISPEAGLRRAGARKRLQIINSGYGNYGANTTKKSLKGWIFGGGSAREDIEDNLPVLRERCRDLYMGVPLATGALKTCRTNVVGQGLTLKSQIDYEYLGLEEEDAQELEARIEREFALWADSTAGQLQGITAVGLPELAYVRGRAGYASHNEAR